jgi:hypothetical protein
MEAAMAMLAQVLSKNSFSRPRVAKAASVATAKLGPSLWLAMSTTVVGFTGNALADDVFLTKAPAIPFSGFNGPAYNWNGFYAGGHFGVGWGSSNWTAAPGISGSTNLFQTIDTFDEGGSFFAGLQGGYNYMLSNRVLLGAEVDETFPAFQTLPVGINPFGLSTGGTSNFTSPTLGAVGFAEAVLASGTVRGRIGYAPGHWLFYAPADSPGPTINRR